MVQTAWVKLTDALARLFKLESRDFHCFFSVAPSNFVAFYHEIMKETTRQQVSSSSPTRCPPGSLTDADRTVAPSCCEQEDSREMEVSQEAGNMYDSVAVETLSTGTENNVTLVSWLVSSNKKKNNIGLSREKAE